MKKVDLRSEYDQILSDMLLMQYRIEVFRRRMQVEHSVSCSQVSLAIDEAVEELTDLGTRPCLAPVVKKSWWEIEFKQRS